MQGTLFKFILQDSQFIIFSLSPMNQWDLPLQLATQTHLLPNPPPSQFNNNFNRQPRFGPEVLYSNKRLQNINCIVDPNDREGGLFLGDVLCLIKKELLTNNKISIILSCMTHEDGLKAHINFNQLDVPQTISARKAIPAQDSLNYPLDIHFDQTYDYIENGREQGKNVLVHCHAGLSRSAAIVCAYLMKKNNWGVEQAMKFLRSRRERVRPNVHFLELLKQYESKLYGNHTTTSNAMKNGLINSNQQNKHHFQNELIQSKYERLDKSRKSEIQFQSYNHQIRKPQSDISNSRNYYTPHKNMRLSQDSNLQYDYQKYHFNSSCTVFSASKSVDNVANANSQSNYTKKEALLSTGQKQHNSNFNGYYLPPPIRSQQQIKVSAFNHYGEDLSVLKPSLPSTYSFSHQPNPNLNDQKSNRQTEELPKNNPKSKIFSYDTRKKRSEIRSNNDSKAKIKGRKQKNQANCFLEGIRKLCS